MNNIALWLKYANELTDAISAAGQPGVCTFAQGEISGCEQPSFDDSTWKKVMGKGAPINGINVNSGNVEKKEETLDLCDWSMVDGPAAMRKRICLPESIEGVLTEGSKVFITLTMLAPLDIYIDGKKAASYKYWGDTRQCELVVTDSYKKGDTHVAVFTTPQNDGDAHLGVYFNCEALEEKLLLVSTAIQQLEFLKKLATVDRNRVEKVYSSLSETLSPEALKSRDWKAIEKDINEIDRILADIDELAKEFKVHIISHSHLDMNWLWDYEDTIDICVRDFRTIVGMLDEFPDLTFSQSQSCVYDIVAKNDPDTFKRILEKIKNGQWEVTAATWSEHDLYTSAEETFVNQLLQAAKYAQNVLKTKPSRVCWEPDTFGHPATVPNVLSKAGVKYYYHFRCNPDGEALKWWEGTDGSRILDYCFGPYNNSLRPFTVMPVVNKFFSDFGIKTSMFVFGVGDHGGGPSRRDIRIKQFLSTKNGLPTLVFSKVCDFFDEMLNQKQDWPVHKGEQELIFEGCYTAKSKIKKYLRDGDARLNDAQAALAAGMFADKNATAQAELNKAWEKVCFNGFHDISCGCNIKAPDEYDYRIGQEAIDTANEVMLTALDINKSNDKITVFNSLAFTRTDIVSLKVDCNINESGLLLSECGETPYQVINATMYFIAKNLPALCTRVYEIKNKNEEAICTQVRIATGKEDGSVYAVENERYLLELSARTGTIVTLFDKKKNEDVLQHNQGLAEVPYAFAAQNTSNLFKVVTEEPHIMSAWVLGNEASTQNIISNPQINVVCSGPVLTQINVTYKYNLSTFTTEIKLYTDLSRVDFAFNLDWQEAGHYKKGVPVLKVGFNSAIKDPKYIYETPMGSVERSVQNAEVPAYRYIALHDEAKGIALFNDNKHGFNVSGQKFDMSLVRGSYSPDAYPDKGEVIGRYAICPYYENLNGANLKRDAMMFNSPIVAMFGETSEEWTKKNNIEFENKNIVILSVKPSFEADKIVLTAVEANGKKTKTKFCFEGSGIKEVDLLQNEMREIGISECEVLFGANEIKSFVIEK